MRTGPDAAADSLEPTRWLDATLPLPGVAAYATASVLVDVPSGRLAGVFVVDNSAQAGEPPFLPSCVAFEPDAASPLHATPLVVVMTTAHHYNDALRATLHVATAAPPAVLVLRNGLGAPMDPAASPAPGGGVDVALVITPLPQYLELPPDASAVAACRTLAW